MRRAFILVFGWFMLGPGPTGCNGSSGGLATNGQLDGGGGPEGGTSTDGGGIVADSGARDAQGKEAGGGWQPAPLTCTQAGSYDMGNWSGTCGHERWSIKTGTDGAAASVGLLPQIVTTTDLVTRMAPASIMSFTPRTGPTETTLYALRDVRVQFVRMETDSDYHLVVSEGPYTMIVEVPFPGCVSSGPWDCAITRARAAVDAKYHPTPQGASVNDVATVVGVGFWDFEHGQSGAAPNNVELHPVLAVCFGAGCSPY
jgi:hypothetical protein